MRDFIPDLDGQLLAMGLQPMNESATPVTVRRESVGPRMISLEEQMQQWGLGGGSPEKGAHLEDFNLGLSAQEFLSSATFTESYQGHKEVRALDAPPSPVAQQAMSVDECGDKDMDMDEASMDVDGDMDSDEPMDESLAFIEHLVSYLDEDQFAEVLEELAEGDVYLEVITRSMLDALAEGIDDVLDGEEFILRLENSDSPAALEEARRLKALIGGVVKKLKKTSAKMKSKSKSYYRKNKGKIKKKKKKQRKSATFVRKLARKVAKAKRRGTRKSMGMEPVMAESTEHPSRTAMAVGPNRGRRLTESLFAATGTASQAERLCEEIGVVVQGVALRQQEQAASTWQKLSDISSSLAEDFDAHATTTGEDAFERLSESLAGVSETAAYYAQEIRQGHFDLDDPALAQHFREHLDSTTKAAELHVTLFGEGSSPDVQALTGRGSIGGMDADEEMAEGNARAAAIGGATSPRQRRKNAAVGS